MNYRITRSDDFLSHYASPYYDPVKAHEYYMEHRKLKGRHSTAGLSEEGKKVAAYIKQRMNEERKGKIDAHREQTTSEIKSAREALKNVNKAESERAASTVKQNAAQVRDEISKHSASMNSKIEQLRSQYSHMDSKARSRNQAALSAKINSLRIENQRQREKIQGELAARNLKVRESAKAANETRSNQVKTGVKQLQEAHQQYRKDTKAEYDEAYDRELEKLSSEFKAPKKGKSSKSGSSGAIRQASETWRATAAKRDSERQAAIEERRKARK